MNGQPDWKDLLATIFVIGSMMVAIYFTLKDMVKDACKKALKEYESEKESKQ